MNKDYYEILGVSKTASQDDIKKAYRKLAMKYHPDKNPDDKVSEEKFKAVAEAYSVLGDPDKRKKYDNLGFYYNDSGTGAGHGASGGFSDIFEQVFGSGGRSGRGRRRTSDYDFYIL